MQFSRRQFLTYSAVGLAAGVAGCSDEGEVTNPTENDDDPQVSDQTPDGAASETSTPTPDSDGAVAELGEELIYTEGDKKLSFTASDAVLQDAIITSYSNVLSSQVPSNANHTFLLLTVSVENIGDEQIRTPADPVFVLNGRQYEREYILQGTDRYTSYNELLPGSQVTGELAYAIPPSEAQGQVVVDFSTFGEATTGTWTINTGDLERTTYEYRGLSPGEVATFGTETRQYEITARAATEAQSYTYSSNGYEFEETPSDGNKFVFVPVTARNTGEQAVHVPSIYDMSLLSGSSQYSATIYFGNNDYESGAIDPGIRRTGQVLFEVSQSVSDYTFQVDFTREITASWNL